MSKRTGTFAFGVVCPVVGSVKYNFAVTTEASAPFCVMLCGLDDTVMESARLDGPLSGGASVWCTVHAASDRAAAAAVAVAAMKLNAFIGLLIPKIAEVHLDV